MNKPNALPVLKNNIPVELRALDRWVVWKYELRKGKWAKPPRQINDRYASSNDPHTWIGYAEAIEAYESGKFDGIGLVLPDGIVGIDLDDCFEGSKFSEESKMLLAMLPTYCEFSPSGTGVKMLAAGNLSDKLSKVSHAKGIELYDGGDTNRYFTITGNVIPQSRGSITGQRDSLFAIQSMITEPKASLEFVGDDPERSQKAFEYLRHISRERADSYAEWLQVGMAASWCDRSEEMFDAWSKWSSDSPKYSEEACREKWESFRREKGRLLTLAHLERLARADGYDPDKYSTGAITGEDLLGQVITREYLIKDFLVVNEPMIIGGASKTCKTSIAMDMAVSIATGAKFMGRFEVEKPQSVMFVSGESGAATLQENLRKMIEVKNLKPADLQDLHISFKLPKLDDPKTVEDILEELRAKNVKILFIDPLYRSLRAGESASNVYAMGEILELIAERVIAQGITLILLHHFRKQGKNYSEPPELEDLSQSGMAEFGRQFLLLKRRAAYKMDGKHTLYFNWGGSAGHQGAAMVDVYTGTRQVGIHWDTTFRTLQEWEALQKDQKEVDTGAKIDATSEKILEVIGANPGITTKKLITAVGGGKATFMEALDALVYSMEVHSEVGPRNSKKWFLDLPEDENDTPQVGI
jgi:hypothetical protein